MYLTLVPAYNYYFPFLAGFCLHKTIQFKTSNSVTLMSTCYYATAVDESHPQPAVDNLEGNPHRQLHGHVKQQMRPPAADIIHSKITVTSVLLVRMMSLEATNIKVLQVNTGLYSHVIITPHATTYELLLINEQLQIVGHDTNVFVTTRAHPM